MFPWILSEDHFQGQQAESEADEAAHGDNGREMTDSSLSARDAFKGPTGGRLEGWGWRGRLA